jgi:hypothetical protein
VVVVAVVALTCGLVHAAGDTGRTACNGFVPPAGSKKLGEDPKECRFVSPLNWAETVKYLNRNTTSQIRWHREVNIPAAKYLHLESTHPKTPWEAINVYQLRGDAGSDVRVYIIPRPVPKADPVEKAKPEASSEKKGGKKGKK